MIGKRVHLSDITHLLNRRERLQAAGRGHRAIHVGSLAGRRRQSGRVDQERSASVGRFSGSIQEGHSREDCQVELHGLRI